MCHNFIMLHCTFVLNVRLKGKEVYQMAQDIAKIILSVVLSCNVRSKNGEKNV